MVPAVLLANSGLSQLLPLTGVAGGLYIFVCGFRIRQHRRRIEKTPISKICSARLGQVEVSGLADGPRTVTSPISGTTCYCYRAIVWQERHSGKELNWEVAGEEKAHVPFFLTDKTAKLLIDPAGAELDLSREFHQEFSTGILSLDGAAPPAVRSFFMRHSIIDNRKTRVEEYCTKPKSFLFVRGTLVRNPGVEVMPREAPTCDKGAFGPGAHGSSPFTCDPSEASFEKSDDRAVRTESALRSQEVVDLTEAPPTPDNLVQMTTQQAKIAAALQRAGIVTPDIRSFTDQLETTGSTQRPAISAGPTSVPSSDTADAPKYDLKPAVILGKGKNNAGFLISWRDPRAVIHRMHWKSAMMIWGGPALMLGCLSLLAAQLGWL